ncbi:RNA polymerase sigma factor [Streptococcus zalophi]|uniref:Sigma-70 family RNA polymerase sigma factor n=1 Tax=Streptococcus zalophi TaxID=640031 RepID=A0A934P8M4_9STRE|nr:sigma-70 family RNA polymerase sigma factor [Streptococcus zalophi]MBJ8349166.1 sigma-70 family RNA polymerase sigma factor [Streptococcus zalophi]MCR8967212.1 sigma-70 family RNA polymerase sigma factor [Streptococcus zalophi]
MGIIKLDAYETELVKIAQEVSFYLRKSTISKEDSLDITQDILVKLLESEIILPLDKLRSWFYRSAIRLYIDRYRRDKKYHELIQKSFFNEKDWLKYDDDSYSYLYEAIEELSERYQLVLDCYYFQGFTIKETAKLLGMSQSQVKTNLYRGRQQLKTLLLQKGYNDGNKHF